MNAKDGFSDGTNTNAMFRLLYSKKTYNTEGQKKWGAQDASTTIMRNRNIALGKTVQSTGFTGLSHAKGNSVRDALRRVRAGGSTVPKKVGMKK